ncbi:unnamed protein product [Choristocarpus tenellus]
MFPNLQTETLLAIWRFSGGSTFAAVEQALAAGNGVGPFAEAPERPPHLRYVAANGSPSAQSALGTPPPTMTSLGDSLETASQHHGTPPPLLVDLGSSHERGRQQPSSRTRAPLKLLLPSPLPSVSSWTTSGSVVGAMPKEEQLPPFTPRVSANIPGRTPRGGHPPNPYIMHSGELSILNELQLPRRGSRIALHPEFLRIPSGGTAAATPCSPAGEDVFVGIRTDPPPDQRGSFDRSVSWSSNLLKTHHTPEQGEGEVWVGGAEGLMLPGKSDWSAGSITTGNRTEWDSGTSAAVLTASSFEVVSAFPPGTCYRVAVDKGVTGLGIMLKLVGRRFVIYGLQPLADGSPGGAEVR